MEKMNEKTTCARLFNGLFREQSAKFVYRILLCFILLIPASSVCAQSNEDKVEIQLKKGGDDFISNNEGVSERDFELEAILPIAMYDTLNDNLVFISQYVTFESVTYYIMDDNGIIVETDEIILPKNIEVISHLLQLSPGSYIIVLEIDGVYFQGMFVK